MCGEAYVSECRYVWKPEEDIDLRELEYWEIVSHLAWVLGTKLRLFSLLSHFSSPKIVDLHCEHHSISTVLHINGELCLLAPR